MPIAGATRIRRAQTLVRTALVYGVTLWTTVCTALRVPLTTLCATFFAVFAELFATVFAVLTGPASTVPMEIAQARMIENNAFIVLNIRF